MKNRERLVAAGVLMGALLLSSQLLVAGSILRCPNESDPLESRWNWGFQKTSAASHSKGVWVGYSIKKMMRLNAFYYMNGMFSFGNSDGICTFLDGGSFGDRGKSLGEQLYGKDYESPIPDGDTLREMARKSLDRLDGRRHKYPEVSKDIAFLFFFERGSRVPAKMAFCNLEVPFDSEKHPLIWLGSAQDEESFFFVKKMYAGIGDVTFKRKLLSAVGMHSTVDLAIPFLSGVLRGKDVEKVRGRAAVELGEFDTQKSVDILLHVIKHDRSSYVRKRAVYGLEDIRLESAVDAIIDAAKTSTDLHVRKAAISTLGDLASRKASQALQSIVYRDDDTAIQKYAVYALEDFPNGEGIPLLIKIAKTHHKVPVRKSAIHCLGDSKDPRALDTLIEIIKN